MANIDNKGRALPNHVKPKEEKEHKVATKQPDKARQAKPTASLDTAKGLVGAMFKWQQRTIDEDKFCALLKKALNGYSDAELPRAVEDLRDIAAALSVRAQRVATYVLPTVALEIFKERRGD